MRREKKNAVQKIKKKKGKKKMGTNAGYKILKTELFNENRGIALGMSSKEVAKYVTWEFIITGEEKDYFWGHYFDNMSIACEDYHRRLAERYKECPF